MAAPLVIEYNGKPLTVRSIADIVGCNPKVIYRYYHKHGSLDGFDRRDELYPLRIQWEGKMQRAADIARSLNVSVDAVRRYYKRNGSMEGYKPHTREKGKPIEYLEHCYHTLNGAIPLDRCIAAAGYRSIRQFCKDNDLSDSLVGRWRRGKLAMYARSLDYLPPRFRNPTLADEMTNFQNGLAIPLTKIMAGTGCLEWELFPAVFTEDFYRTVSEGLQSVSPPQAYEDTSIERNERRRAIEAVLATLPQRHRLVVRYTFGLNRGNRELTYEEIGRRLGLTRERVRQMLRKALATMMKPSRRHFLAGVSPYPTENAADRTVEDAMKEVYRQKYGE
jgi:RNA polymerase sigma factor (sigma-70 family)